MHELGPLLLQITPACVSHFDKFYIQFVTVHFAFPGIEKKYDEQKGRWNNTLTALFESIVLESFKFTDAWKYHSELVSVHVFKSGEQSKTKV